MRIALTVALVWFLATPLARAGRYTGEWEYQALNAGDTNFQVEHEGGQITFYRVLWPRYEGKKFKLEHLYKGKLSGQRIVGEMWVREEGVSDFERLRAFDGQIRSDDRMQMDDLPLKRVESTPKKEDRGPVEAPPPDEPVRPKYAKVVIQPGARPAPAAQPPAVEAEASTQAAPVRIPILVPVSRRVDDAVRRRAGDLLKAGDVAYAAKDYGLAVEKYAAAFQLNPRQVELLYKLGLCHGILGSKATRTEDRSTAAKHYRRAIAFWQKAVRLDPYNAGAKENIRRAQRKLASSP